MYVTPSQRGANCLRPKILERLYRFRPASSHAIVGLVVLCLLAANLATDTPIACGQAQTSFGSYFQQMPDRQEPDTPITGGAIEFGQVRTAVSSASDQTSSRRSSRRRDAAHNPATLVSKSDAVVAVSDPTVVATPKTRTFPTDHGIEETREISASSERNGQSLSVDAVRKLLSKLAGAIDVGELLPAQAHERHSSRRNQPTPPPSASPPHSQPLARSASTAKPPRVELKQAIPSALNFGRFVTSPRRRLPSGDRPRQADRSSITLSSFLDVADSPTPGRVVGNSSSVDASDLKNSDDIVSAATPPPRADRQQSSRRNPPRAAFANAEQLNVLFAEQTRTDKTDPEVHSGNSSRNDVLDDDKSSTAKQIQSTPATIFRRSPDGRLGRRRHSVPRRPKSKIKHFRTIPIPIARQELPPSRVDVTSNPQSLSTRQTPSHSSGPQTTQLRQRVPISKAAMTIPLLEFVNSHAPQATQRRSPGETSRGNRSTSVLALAGQEVSVLQPPATADSPSDIPRPIVPGGEESVLTPDREPVAEEVVPRPDNAFDRPTKKLGTNIAAPAGEFPEDAAGARFAAAGEVSHGMGARRTDVETVVFWDAPGTAHRPLYFEEVNLERHGYRVPLIQPLLSGAHFFGRVPALPYLMFSENHRQHRYTLGYYRPGSLAPYEWYLPRPSLHGGVAEAAAVTGLLFAFP